MEYIKSLIMNDNNTFLKTIALVITLSSLKMVSSTCSSGYYPYFNDDTICKLCSTVISSCSTCVWDTTYKTVYCSICSSGYYLANPNQST